MLLLEHFFRLRQKLIRMDKNIHDCRHIAPVIAAAIKRMFDPAHSAVELFKNKSIAKSFLELIISIELIQILKNKTKTPNDEFLKFFKIRNQKNPDDGREVLADLVTLLYLDKETTLIKKIIKNPNLDRLSAQEIIDIASRAIDNERQYKHQRKNSDSVKIKGGKNIAIVQFDRLTQNKGGDAYSKEAVQIPVEDFYRKLTPLWSSDSFRGVISEFLKQGHRSDRARNIHRILEYYFYHQDEKVTAKQMSRDLKISEKSLSAVLSALRKDDRLRKVLETLLL